jgi:hypothetical protein
LSARSSRSRQSDDPNTIACSCLRRPARHPSFEESLPLRKPAAIPIDSAKRATVAAHDRRRLVYFGK